MHYLIDGHNLIGRMPDIDLADPNDEVKLVLKLRGWAAAQRQRKLTIFFDGGLPGGRSQRMSSSNVKVIFAPAGKTADLLIINQIKRVKNPAEFILISSDQQIIRAAQARSMKFWRSESFVKRLSQEQSERYAAPEEESPATAVDPTISASDVAEFMELFGPVPEKPVPRRPIKKNTQEQPTKPEKKQSKDTGALKHGEDRLEEDDLDDWLRLFGYEE